VKRSAQNSAQGPKTVQDLPTDVGRSLPQDGYPKKHIMVVQMGYAKLSKLYASDYLEGEFQTWVQKIKQWDKDTRAYFDTLIERKEN
jgi:uncharacterized protein YecE (DUF72 family)